MTDPYPILEVEQKGIGTLEEMGSKSKFWHTHPEDGNYWLFKFPRSNTGEHWAEKVAAEIANQIGIPHANVELAVFQDTKGSSTRSFVSVGQELVHGNQLLSWFVSGYDPDKEYNQSSHTLSNIWSVLDRLFTHHKSKKAAKIRLADYIVFDALIGNTDRHHENWGILRQREDDKWRGFVAPTFDHASSLGRELRDGRRETLLSQNRLGNYVGKGRGAIYWSAEDQHRLSPLDLVQRAFQQYPEILLPALLKLNRLNDESVEQAVRKIPENWISNSARTFAVQLMQYNLRQLRELSR